MLSVLQVGLGPLGRRIAGDLIRRRLGRVAAAVDSDPELDGGWVSSLVPGAEPSLRILPGLDRLETGARFDAAIVATASDLNACAPTLRALLERGLPVVSTCEELVYPRLRHGALAEELHAVGVRRGGRLLGTGVNPGFLMDTVPATVSAACTEIRSMHIARIQDAATRRIPFQRKIGVGLDDEAFAQGVREGRLGHVGLGESLHFVADAVGFELDRWEESTAPVHATREMESGLGPVARGSVCGIRQVADGYSGSRRVIRMEFQAALGQEAPHDRVVIEGDPPVDVVFHGGVHGDTATSAIVLNSIASLLRAPPGLHTMATIPLVHFAGGPAPGGTPARA